MKMIAKRMRIAGLICAIWAGLTLLLANDVPAGAVPITITVNSWNDPGNGGCDVAECTLREAINLANANAGNDTIIFDAANAPYDLVPGAPLPAVDASEGITIDGGGQVGIGGFGAQIGSGLRFWTSPDAVLRNVTIRGLDVYAFLEVGIEVCAGLNGTTCVRDITNVLIEDVKAHDNGKDGISVMGANLDDLRISAPQAVGNGGNGIAVKGTNINNVALTGATVTNHPATGVLISAAASVSDVSVSDSVITDSTGPLSKGLQVYALGGSIMDFSLKNSSLARNHDGVIIAAEGSVVRPVINGNQLTENAETLGHYQYYLSADHVIDAEIRDNTIRDAVGGGIHLIALECCESGGEISNNKVTNNGDVGVDLHGMRAISVVDNEITGNSWGVHSIVAAENSQNLIAGNEISGNARDGVWLYGDLAGTYRISRNAIHGNGEIGIDLGDFGEPDPGVTPNDPGDADVGPNGRLNFPEWMLPTGYEEAQGTACPNCLIEVFGSDNDPSGYGEGSEFLLDVSADAAGNFTVPLCGLGLADGDKVTATATDPAGNTSEFSENYTVLEDSEPCPTPSPSPTPTPTATPSATPTHSPAPTPTGTGTPPAELTQGDVDCNGGVTSVDALKELRYVAQLSVSQAEPCPDIGTEVASFWGDVDCSGSVTSVDALKILRFVALLPVNQSEPCPDVGETA